MSTVNSLKDNILRFRYNPSAIQQVVTEHLGAILNGEVELVDATNPFVFSLENAAVHTAAFMVQNEVNTRRQYPAVAQTEDDIYIHMSDEDFIDRFAVPASTKFTIVARKAEILENMVTDISTGIRKLVIPRNTFFTVNDIVFSMLYPVEIRELKHGGLQIVYNTDQTNPLKELTTNIIKWDVRKIASDLYPAGYDEWLYLEVHAEQFKIETFTEETTVTRGFNRTYSYTDEFYYARVWNKSNSTANKWKEIKTTHTDQVYDNKTPTAVLKVNSSEKTLNVYIPQVYFTTNQITGSIRTDIYDTKGRLVISLATYTPESFVTEWYAIDRSEMNAFTAPLSAIRTIFAYSAEMIDGGRNALTFDELRDRVIKNSIGPQQLPITNVQLESFLSNNNYSIVKNVDVVTNRIYLATRQMPDPFDEKLITAGNSSIETFISSMDALTNYPFIRNNGNRLTIPSNTLFVNENGIINLLSLQDKSSLMVLSNEAFVKAVSGVKYLYNPFYYVLDSSSNEFELRAYHLDDPKIESLTFVDQNDSTGLEINTSAFDIIRVDTGFKIRTKIKSNDALKALPMSKVGAQISFIPENGVRCSINGTAIAAADNEIIFEFDLQSNFDIDADHNLQFLNFNYFDTDDRSVYALLNQRFDIVYYLDESLDPNWSTTAIDDVINRVTAPSTAVGLNHETLLTKFGTSLDYLWKRSRSVLQSAQYQTYTMDEPKVYENDIYETDPETGSIFKINELGQITYNILYHKGEPVIGQDGLIEYKHKAGDVVLDENGKPVPLGGSSILRQMELFFIDGVYLLANDSSAATYRKQMTDAIVNWVVNELGDFNQRSLDQTRIYLYPKTNLGTIKVLADQSQVMNIQANQVFNVHLYVKKSVYENAELRKYLNDSTIREIDNLLVNNVVSNSAIITHLKSIYGEDVISVAITGLGGSANINTITILNEGDRLSIGKKLTALPNGDRIVVEDININFIEHNLGDQFVGT